MPKNSAKVAKNYTKMPKNSAKIVKAYQKDS